MHIPWIKVLTFNKGRMHLAIRFNSIWSNVIQLSPGDFLSDNWSCFINTHPFNFSILIFGDRFDSLKWMLCEPARLSHVYPCHACMQEHMCVPVWVVGKDMCVCVHAYLWMYGVCVCVLGQGTCVCVYAWIWVCVCTLCKTDGILSVVPVLKH